MQIDFSSKYYGVIIDTVPLRTPNTNNTNNAWNVNSSGSGNNNNVTNSNGVVPAIGSSLGRPSKEFESSPFIISRNYYPDLPKRQANQNEDAPFLKKESGAIHFNNIYENRRRNIYL